MSGGEFGAPPDRPRRVVLVFEHERPQNRGAFRRRSRQEDRRLHEWVSEPDRSRWHPLEERRRRGLLGPGRHREPADGTGSDASRLLWAGAAGQRHGEYRQPDGLVELRVPSGELLLDPAHDRAVPSAIRRRGRPTELVQCERVALGAQHEVSTSRPRGRSGDPVEQFVGSRFVERAEVQALDARGLHHVRVPRRHQDHDRVLTDTSSHHAERPLGRRVHPVQVLGDDQERTFGRGIGEQRQRRESCEERRRLDPSHHTERDVQSTALRCRQVRDPGSQRVQEHVQRGVRFGRLGQGAGGRDRPDAEAVRVLEHIGHERRLADPRFAVDHEGRTTTSHVTDRMPECCRLPLTPDDGLRHRHGVSMAAVRQSQCAGDRLWPPIVRESPSAPTNPARGAAGSRAAPSVSGLAVGVCGSAVRRTVPRRSVRTGQGGGTAISGRCPRPSSRRRPRGRFERRRDERSAGTASG